MSGPPSGGGPSATTDGPLSGRRDCREGAPVGGNEAGSVAIVALALGVVVVLAGLAAFDVGLLAAARARAQTAADLAALAALTTTGEPAVSSATTIAQANGAELLGCACSSGEAVVTVGRQVVIPPTGLQVLLRARARAVLPHDRRWGFGRLVVVGV